MRRSEEGRGATGEEASVVRGGCAVAAIMLFHL